MKKKGQALWQRVIGASAVKLAVVGSIVLVVALALIVVWVRSQRVAIPGWWEEDEREYIVHFGGKAGTRIGEIGGGGKDLGPVHGNNHLIVQDNRWQNYTYNQMKLIYLYTPGSETEPSPVGSGSVIPRAKRIQGWVAKRTAHHMVIYWSLVGKPGHPSPVSWGKTTYTRVPEKEIKQYKYDQ
ncbi:MAG: hypothetical protein LKJ69_08395 [Lactobacillus sp.]|jgi:hypothetical protein|nr:hypothetical protein [Lactobacillus sp.]MCI2033410.1 hypothetical protein [Lactobacillus sp.]